MLLRGAEVSTIPPKMGRTTVDLAAAVRVVHLVVVVTNVVVALGSDRPRGSTPHKHLPLHHMARANIADREPHSATMV